MVEMCAGWNWLSVKRQSRQTKVEDIVQEVFDAYKTNHHIPQFILQREKHFHYLKRGLRQLTEAYERWVTSRQMRFEGGFQGRCNKLVDGCYSFWQAGLLPLLHRALHAKGDPALSMTHWMFDQSALQEYILLCCQCPAGGLLDKPGKSRDFYHTCYCLSGLAIAQHFGSGDLHHQVVLGAPENRLQATHPVYNITPEKVVRAVMHFLQQPVPSLEPAAE
ncbi:protein farnesyltransferase subunit beta [Amazona aestiva]|uniref:Protein farnesyltransferase subunit beta n=1 Tax=Amazona aestiva TaxID=12930 RepID=A0A0Q3SKQ6_AMAAE|nr:protein farnesyltransferase subunit beta [Amazona aestiva]